jgi:hypothetical protein
MKHLFIGRKAAATAAAVAILSSGAIMASAQAATVSKPHFHIVVVKVQPPAKRAVQPDFTCTSPGICVYQGDNFNGAPTDFVPSLEPDRWLNLTTNGINTLPWGSFNNNSGSSLIIADGQTQRAICILPAEPPPLKLTRADIVADLGSAILHDRYVFIEYGNATCSDKNVPPPPP